MAEDRLRVDVGYSVRLNIEALEESFNPENAMVVSEIDAYGICICMRDSAVAGTFHKLELVEVQPVKAQ